jgi:F-type H+-transporting ATPase subunit alpha
VNVGISVSRVGGSAQVKAMRKVAGSLRLDLSQFRELEAFTAFASDLDAASKAQLDRGARLVELLKQPQYNPYPVEEQVVSIFLGTQGHLDAVPVSDVRRFETEFLDHLRGDGGILAEIRDTRELPDELEERLVSAINDFKYQFSASDGKPVIGDAAEAMDADEVGTEAVKVNRPAPGQK